MGVPPVPTAHETQLAPRCAVCSSRTPASYHSLDAWPARRPGSVGRHSPFPVTTACGVASRPTVNDKGIVVGVPTAEMQLALRCAVGSPRTPASAPPTRRWCVASAALSRQRVVPYVKRNA